MVNQSALTGDTGDIEDVEDAKSQHSSELSTNSELSTARTELLQAVLAPEAYPWLADETARHYHTQAEAAGQALEISDEEAMTGWQTLSAQLDQHFDRLQFEQPNEFERPSSASLTARIKQKFSDRLPADMIARIGEKAQQMVSSGESASYNVLEQMMACVQEVLSHVANEDLRVIARPLAMAMRSSSTDEFVEATIKSVRTAEWATLSPIEQARLGLAAARYAISEAESQA